MVDIHCHLLPGIDDGAKSWEISKEMCRIAADDGIRHIVCTPHANDEYHYNRTQHQELLRQVKNLVGDMIDLSLGCDFHFSFENIQAVLQNPREFCIAEGPYLLVEFSDYALAPNTEQNLVQLMDRGIRPVITHPERNMIMQRKPEMILDMAKLGCVIQITANSITGHWGEGPKKTSTWLLNKKAVHVVSSDAHDTKHRPPILSKARQFLRDEYGEYIADSLVSQNPAAIVAGDDLPYFPEPKRKGWLS